MPYGVIGARSNARWWLIPVSNRRIAVSGMALFQPILRSARLMKRAVSVASRVGLHRLWARQILHLAGDSTLGNLYGQPDLHFAFFTGTDSPHRKSAVQVMDRLGHIKGFVKVTLNPAIGALIEHEAGVLRTLSKLHLSTASTPAVVFDGVVNRATVLATDSLKTDRSITATTLRPGHLAFLAELAAKTTEPQLGRTVITLRRGHAALALRLSQAWQSRFDRGLTLVDLGADQLMPCSLTHGDFTPWNTFFESDRLYVFDWEYAGSDFPGSNDLIHFLRSRPGFCVSPALAQLADLAKHLNLVYGFDQRQAQLHLIVYLMSHALRFAARVDDGHRPIVDWDGATETAALFDAILARNG